MSNTSAGGVYHHIIERVIIASENDFEELGVDRQTLEEMKETWQQKLSELHVAALPWDPPPAPPQLANPPTVPSNVAKHEDNPKAVVADTKPVTLPSSSSSAAKPEAAADAKPAIKTEGFDSGSYLNNGSSGLNRQTAQQRAAGIMQQSFGQQAEASIAAGLQQQQQQQQQQQSNGGASSSAQPDAKPSGSSSLQNAQTDGSADTKDEDAINSDLDDPEDELDVQETDDANVSEVMVCVYDKVARVKNKWKCTLKDGILSTNGKDYVFHKATGEFEW